jgi:hypothetical protein
VGKTGKSLSLILVLILVIPCASLLFKPANAQTIPKPAVPEFTLKLVDYMEGGGLETQIKNQPIILNGHDTASIFYDRRIKWHESINWYHPEPDPTKWKRQYIAESGTTGVTTLVGSPNSYYEILGSSTSHQLDVQYRAINGYLNESVPFAPPIGIDPNDTPVVVVNTSEWSETVTITLPDYKPETTTNPTVIPSTEPTESNTSNYPTATPVPSNEFTFFITVALIVISVFMILVFLFLIILYKKIQKS